MSSDRPPADQDSAAQFVAELLRLAIASAPGASAGGFSSAPAILQLAQQVWLAGVTSTYRGCVRMFEAWGEAMPALTRAASELSDPRRPADGALVDELRGRLRALAEIPLDEARRLQGEIDALVAQRWGSRAPAPDEPYWRRWTPKS